ncbi:MAG: pyocin activator PrtN family protein [Steroidobacteraceae bacterium]
MFALIGRYLARKRLKRIFNSRDCWRSVEHIAGTLQVVAVNSTYFGLLAEFGEANIPLDRVAPKYFGLSCGEARRRAPAKQLPCRAFRLGGQKSPWLVSATDLAELIDARRQKAG